MNKLAQLCAIATLCVLTGCPSDSGTGTPTPMPPADSNAGSGLECPSERCQQLARQGGLTEDIGRCSAGFEGCAGYTTSGQLAACESCRKRGALCPFCGASIDPSVPRPPRAATQPAFPPGAQPLAEPRAGALTQPAPRPRAPENSAYCVPCQTETGGILTKSVGRCGACGGETNSGMLAACFACAKAQSTCALCSHPVQ